MAVVPFDAFQELLEADAGEFSVMPSEGQDLLRKLVQAREIVGGQEFALEDEEVDLVNPGGMDMAPVRPCRRADCPVLRLN